VIATNLQRKIPDHSR